MKKVILLFLACVALGIMGTAPSFAQDWPMFRHDLQHTGYSTSTVPSTNNVQWSYVTGQSVNPSPAVADGKVFIGSGKAMVYCFGSVVAVPTGLVAYPNPFSLSRHTSLTLSGFSVPGGKIKIYNLAGQLIRTLEVEYGADEVLWDGRNDKDEQVAAGIYVCYPGGKIAVVE